MTDPHKRPSPPERGPGPEERLHCPVAEECGGCALIGSDYAEQLTYKSAAVRAALSERAELGLVEVNDCLPAVRRSAYRNRAKLAVEEVAGDVRMGLHRRETNQVVDLAPCRVQDPILMDALPGIRQWLKRNRLGRPQGPVRYVDLRSAADDRVHLTLVVESPPTHSPDLPLDELAGEVPELCGISINHNPAGSSYVLGPTTRTPWGGRSFLAVVPTASGEPRRFEVPATGFFQVAPAQLAPIHALMAEHLGQRGGLFDVYCGVGVHGLTLALSDASAGTGEELVGIEESAAAAACARRNADSMGVPARFHTGRVEKVLARLADRRSPRRLILNPGRPGCRPEALRALAACPQGRLAYLSCNPDTLARDLVRLVEQGWTLKRVIPVDMMPQTDQVEALALLRNEKASS